MSAADALTVPKRPWDCCASTSGAPQPFTLRGGEVGADAAGTDKPAIGIVVGEQQSAKVQRARRWRERRSAPPQLEISEEPILIGPCRGIGAIRITGSFRVKNHLLYSAATIEHTMKPVDFVTATLSRTQ